MPYLPAQYTSGVVGPSYTVTGLKETLSMLENLPQAIVLNGFSRALHAAGQIMEDAVEAKTPIRLTDEGGDIVVSGGGLKADVFHEVILDAQYRGGVAIVGFRRLGHIANFVEYGHRMVGHKPGKKQLKGPKTLDGFVRPYPFMRPAFEASKDAAVEAFASTLRETVERLNTFRLAA